MGRNINNALLMLARRAETNTPEVLRKTFVDAGNLSTAMGIRDHQVIYGRRGTGKTHALGYLAESARARGETAVSIDLRTVGSTGGLYADPAIRLQERASRLLVDVLGEIHNTLFEELIPSNGKTDFDPDVFSRALDTFQEQSSRIKVTGQVEVEQRNSDSSEDSAAIDAGGTAGSKPSLTGKFSSSSKSIRYGEARTKQSGIRDYSLHFGGIGSALDTLLQHTKTTRLWLLLDEWSALPLDLQPVLADFIKRCFFPLGKVTVKIAAIEQRSRFRTTTNTGDFIGIELGADASADVDLDDFMVFDSNPQKANDFFSALPYNHLKVIVEESKLTVQLRGATGLVSDAFTQITAFSELVRSSEGVPRDAINLICMAAQKAGDEQISVAHIRNAARSWYQRDKQSAVAANGDAQELLHWVIDEVIGKRQARAFLAPLGAVATNDLLSKLFDARVIHVIKRGISSNDQPGKRFDAIALDYGCYVDLVSTQRAPKGLFAVVTDDSMDSTESYPEVPQDDYRSIRRAILNLDDFFRR